MAAAGRRTPLPNYVLRNGEELLASASSRYEVFIHGLEFYPTSSIQVFFTAIGGEIPLSPVAIGKTSSRCEERQGREVASLSSVKTDYSVQLCFAVRPRFFSRTTMGLLSVCDRVPPFT